LQNGCPHIHSSTEHRHARKTNFHALRTNFHETWEPKAKSPHNPPSTIPNAHPTKNPPAPRIQQRYRAPHGGIHATEPASTDRAPDLFGRIGFHRTSREAVGRCGAATSARGEPSARRHQPISLVAAAAPMGIRRWAIWGFRVSDVSRSRFIFPFACGWMRRASRSVYPHPAGCCAQTACAVRHDL
jgi:hypothetical protein